MAYPACLLPGRFGWQKGVRLMLSFCSVNRGTIFIIIKSFNELNG